MNDTKQLNATWLAMLTLQTIGTIDLKHKLPAPRQYVALSVVWGVLFLAADMGYARLAARFSMLVLLIGAVLGPFGMRLVGFLQSIAIRFSSSQTSPQAGGTGTGLSSPSQGPVMVPLGAPVSPATTLNT